MQQFTFTPPVSPTANSFLKRSAAHLATLTPKARETWFRLWIPAMRAAPVGEDVGAMDHSLVVITLERWRDQPFTPAMSEAVAEDISMGR